YVTSNTATLTGEFVLNGAGGVQFYTGSGSTLQLVSAGTPSSINSGLLDVSGQGTTILVPNPTFDSLFGNFTVDNGATFQMGDGSGNAAPFGSAVDDEGTLVFNSSANLAQNTAINGGGSLVNTGTGTLTLGGANGYAGNTTINNGTLALGG